MLLSLHFDRFSVVVPLINWGTSLYAGFVIFCVLGYMAKQAGVDVEDIADSGEFHLRNLSL